MKKAIVSKYVGSTKFAEAEQYVTSAKELQTFLKKMGLFQTLETTELQYAQNAVEFKIQTKPETTQFSH